MIVVIVAIMMACTATDKDQTSSISRIHLGTELYATPADLLESYELIKLETDDKNALFRQINKLVVVDDTLAIYDNPSQKVVIFDHAGNFIHHINAIGKGPGEYTFLNDISYHQELLLLDQKQVLRYSLSGQWLGTEKVDLAAGGRYFEKNNAAFLFYRSNYTWYRKASPYNLASFSVSNFALMDSASLISQELLDRGLYIMNPLSKAGDEAFALLPFDSVIYKMDKNGILDTLYQLEIPEKFNIKHDTDWKNLQIKDHELMGKLVKMESYQMFGGLQVGTEHLIFAFNENQKFRLCLFNRKNGQTHVFYSDQLIENTIVSPLAIYGDYFYFSAHYKTSEIRKQQIGELENPVLYKVKFKSIPK